LKSKLILLLILLISAINYSQTQPKINFTEKDKLVYLDSMGVKPSQSDYAYYRIVKDYTLNKNRYQVLDYYKSGALQMEGLSNSKEFLEENGLFTYYYENGNKKAVANYVNGVREGQEVRWYKNGTKQSVQNYVKGKLDGDNASWYENGNQKATRFYIRGGVNGKVTEWYENGNKKSEVVYEFVTTKLSATRSSTITEVKINQFWDENGVQKVIDGNGDYEETSKNYKASGKIKDGNKDGIWKGVYLDSNYSYSETYQFGKLVSGVGIDKNNVTHMYNEVRSAPAPKKGMDDFMSHITKNFKGPNVEGLKGKIYVNIVIDADGTVQDIKVIRDLGFGSGKEAIRVVKSYSGGWKPAELRGQKVKFTYSLPLNLIGKN